MEPARPTRPEDLEPAERRARHTAFHDPVPPVVVELAAGGPVARVWRNQLGGLTFRIEERYVKWNPRRSGIDLDRERQRLEWIDGLHPAPHVLAHGGDDEAQWLVTQALPGESVIAEAWQQRRPEAVRAVAAGLRALHSIPVDHVPAAWRDDAWPNRTPAALGPRPPVEDRVVLHGDACAPNTLIGPDGTWTGTVDLGDLTVGDRWADLAVASMSIGWNFGEGHDDELFEAYGIAPDKDRIAWYRALWRLES